MPYPISRRREIREFANRNKVRIFYEDGRFSAAKFNDLWERAIEKCRKYNSGRSDGSTAWEMYIATHAELYFQLKYMNKLEFPNQPRLKTPPSKQTQTQEERYEARAKQEEAWDREQRERKQMFQKSKQMQEESKSMKVAKMNARVPRRVVFKKPNGGKQNTKPITDRSNRVVKKDPERETIDLTQDSPPYSTSRTSTSIAVHFGRRYNVQEASTPSPQSQSHRRTALDLQQERRLAAMESNDAYLNPVETPKLPKVEQSSIFPRAALDYQLENRLRATHLSPIQDSQAAQRELSPTFCYRTDPQAFEIALEELITSYSSSLDDISMDDEFCGEDGDGYGAWLCWRTQHCKLSHCSHLLKSSLGTRGTVFIC